MVHGEVAGLKNRELMIAGVPKGDYEDKVVDRLLRFYR